LQKIRPKDEKRIQQAENALKSTQEREEREAKAVAKQMVVEKHKSMLPPKIISSESQSQINSTKSSGQLIPPRRRLLIKPKHT
jgi:predicted transcriptional regulator